MELLLVRHAIAEDLRPGGEDQLRSITPKGRSRFETAVRGMLRLGWKTGELYCSPWQRALESAAILAPICPSFVPQALPLLAEEPEQPLLQFLADPERADRVALVGHEPWLGELAAWLVSGSRLGLQGLRLRKGGAIWLRGVAEAGCMDLEALVKPSLLRSVGESRD